MFLCQLSGSVPIEPVITTTEGLVYEKRLILKFLETSEVDPVTKNPLTKNDLVELNNNRLINKPSSAAVHLKDIPEVLALLQNRYDELILELASVRNERDEARHQITHLMYLRDSATRLIAKHLQQNELLETKLKDAERENPLASRAQLSVEAADHISSKSSEMMRWRKTRPPPPELDLEKMQQNEETCLGNFGNKVSCFDICLPGEKQPRIICAGKTTASWELIVHKSMLPNNDDVEMAADGGYKTFATNRSDNGKITTIKSFVQPTGAEYANLSSMSLIDSHNSTDQGYHFWNVFTGSSQNVVTHWALDRRSAEEEIGEGEGGDKFKESDDEGIETRGLRFSPRSIIRLPGGSGDGVNSIQMHPTGCYLGVGNGSDCWFLTDINQGVVAQKYKIEASVIRRPVFQPDGSLCLAANNSSIPVWDVRTSEIQAKAECSHPVVNIGFSPNGYMFAVLKNNCGVDFWDLRKLEVVQSLENSQGGGSLVTAPPSSPMQYDESGKNLLFSVGGQLNLIHQVDKKKYAVQFVKEHRRADVNDLISHHNFYTYLARDGAVYNCSNT